jgi:anti-sigma B factor antagonist
MPETHPTRSAARPPQLSASLRETANAVTHVCLAGELDMATVPQVEQLLADRAGSGCIVLDLSRLEFIDSTGISLIVRAHADAERDGCELKIVPGAEEIQRIFRLVDLEDRLPFIGRPAPPDRDGSMP